MEKDREREKRRDGERQRERQIDKERERQRKRGRERDREIKREKQSFCCLQLLSHLKVFTTVIYNFTLQLQF